MKEGFNRGDEGRTELSNATPTTAGLERQIAALSARLKRVEEKGAG